MAVPPLGIAMLPKGVGLSAVSFGKVSLRDLPKRMPLPSLTGVGHGAMKFLKLWFLRKF
jgi:hypothetical protein